MKIYRMGITALILSLALLTAACGTFQVEVESASDAVVQSEDTEPPTQQPLAEEVQPTATQEGTTAESSTKRYIFEELGISLEVPADLYVEKVPMVNLDDSSKLAGYQFYIQNYGHPGGSSSGDFQMYGHIQFGTFPLYTVSWEEFSSNTLNSPMNAYANYIEIDGLRGYDTQFSGERNRFVYQFHLDQHVLLIAVSAPTPENKALADQIISTLKVIPGGVSDASQVISISEPNSLYQLLIPEDWEYTFNPTPTINLSEFEASSPDLEIVAEEGAGHQDLYYKQGVQMTLIVFEGDSDIGEPYRDVNRIQYGVYFNGIEGTEYIFTEPSTAEGKLREVRIPYDGKSYVLRFGYAMDADTDAIDRIIRSFTLQE
ncbi:MAG: hypothetical protein E4G99_02045 [Anaerolineales bacterium]|nr:MAG: hypothetical protein E4G99_02045 [Anaerolineales bacterium]